MDVSVRILLIAIVELLAGGLIHGSPLLLSIFAAAVYFRLGALVAGFGVWRLPEMLPAVRLPDHVLHLPHCGQAYA